MFSNHSLLKNGAFHIHLRETINFNLNVRMRINSSHILLENIRFFANHGVAAQETTIGNEFTINLRLKVDIAQAAEI